MGALVDFITANPLYAIGGVVLLLFLAITVSKKMFKVAIVAVLLNVGYVYYVQQIASDAYQQAVGAAQGAASEAAALAR